MHPQYLSVLGKSVKKSLINFEPVLKGAVISFFNPCAEVFWATTGSPNSVGGRWTLNL